MGNGHKLPLAGLPLNSYAAACWKRRMGRHATLFNVSIAALKSSAAWRFHD
jgi:hypothetical protein